MTTDTAASTRHDEPGGLRREAFSDPLRAQAVGLIAGAFILTLVTILLYLSCSPRPGYQHNKIHRRNRLRLRKHRVASALPSTLPLTLPTVPQPPAPTEEPAEGWPLPA